MSNWTEKHIKGLLFNRKIRSANVPDHRPVKTSTGETVPRKSKSKALIWLEWNLQYFCNEKALTLEQEYQFSKTRQYRSDFAIPALKILLEYEGGIFMDRGGHNSHTGIQRDIDKYQLAQKEGWQLIRLTAINYTTVLKTLNEMI